MESSVKVKNIFALISFFILGLILGIVLCNVGKEEVEFLLGYLKENEVVEDIEVVQEEVLPVSEDSEEEIDEVDTCPIRVDISGAVKKPGVYCMDIDSVVVDAVKKAGGFVEGISAKYLAMRINLASMLYDNSKIYIPYEEDSICELLKFELPKEIIKITEPTGSSQEVEEECISINGATKEELDSLDGVGASTAQKIIDARPYEKIEDLLNVSGIGEATYEKFKEKICL